MMNFIMKSMVNYLLKTLRFLRCKHFISYRLKSFFFDIFRTLLKDLRIQRVINNNYLITPLICGFKDLKESKVILELTQTSVDSVYFF
jgi:hypothetical protein